MERDPDIDKRINISRQVNSSINKTYTEGQLPNGPLVDSLNNGQILNSIPFSCLIQLIRGEYSDCGAEIPKEKREAAYNAFIEATGYKPLELPSSSLSGIDVDILCYVTSFFIFFPILIFAIIIIWLLVLTNRIKIGSAIYISFFAIIITYILSIIYRNYLRSALNVDNSQIQEQIDKYHDNLRDTLAYFPKGFFAASCAITCDGNNCWKCNGSNDGNESNESNDGGVVTQSIEQSSFTCRSHRKHCDNSSDHHNINHNLL